LSQTGRILLVWPNRGRLLTRRLDLQLLQRRCTELGAQLALVTRSSQVRFYAEELGIPVFENRSEAQNARWRTRRRRWRWKRTGPPPDLEALRAASQPRTSSWQNRPAVRLGAFALGVLALLALVACLLPGAQLALTPEARTQEIILPVLASAEITVVNLAGELPARPVSVVVEGRDSLAASGTVQVPYKPAVGGVRFTNLTDQPVSIPAGSVVSTLGAQPIRFATDQAGEGPGRAGQKHHPPSTALLPGPDGNLAPNSLVRSRAGWV
jgi:hypothetical protein